MDRNVYINLGTRDLDKAKAFFIGLGFTLDPRFTNSLSACIVIDLNIFVMLVGEGYLKTFTPKQIVDAHKGTECTIALTFSSKERVDELVERALAMGATENRVPQMQEDPLMYGRSINDFDGHVWEFIWMDPAFAPKHHVL